MRPSDLATPALVVDGPTLDANLAAMAAGAVPAGSVGPTSRPTRPPPSPATSGGRSSGAHGGDPTRGPRARRGRPRRGSAPRQRDRRRPTACRVDGRCGARVTVAVDSNETVDAAADHGHPRGADRRERGTPPVRLRADGRRRNRRPMLHAHAVSAVRGVMGYEGHVYIFEDRAERAAATETAMKILADVHAEGGRRVVSAGATGTYDLNGAATEIQAGTYALMDATYAAVDPGVPAGVLDRDDGREHVSEVRRRGLRPQSARDGPRQPDDRGRRGAHRVGRAHHLPAFGPRASR